MSQAIYSPVDFTVTAKSAIWRNSQSRLSSQATSNGGGQQTLPASVSCWPTGHRHDWCKVQVRTPATEGVWSQGAKDVTLRQRCPGVSD